MTIDSGNASSETARAAKILIVDDNLSLCRSLEMVFVRNGYITIVAHSGAEALEKANDADFNLAILDLKLPDMDGTDLLDLLYESHPDMAIIIATGHASFESAVKALTRRAVAYVTKPFDMDGLLRTVSETVEKQMLLREKLKAERALLESEKKYRVLAEESPQGIAIMQDDKVIYANKAVAAIFGYEVSAMLQMTSEAVWELIHPNDLDHLFQRYSEYETSITTAPWVEFRVIRPDGEIRFLEAIATIVESQGKDAIQIMLIDRTSVKKAEEAKALHQKEIEIYNSLLRHDLGNDLQVVLNDLEFIQLCTSDLTEDAQQALESALAGAERMFSLITALKKPVDDIENHVMNLIGQIAQQSEKAHPGLSISLTPKGQVDNLKIRGSRLLPMVFVNLFSNAIKHAGAAVTVEVSILRRGDCIVVEITDDGPGVDPEIQDNLFQRGVSTTGGGLGLYLSKRIIEAIEGSIEYIPRQPKGAQFRITLPLDIQDRS
ncbi:MAG: response regulator [Candidatus Thorarchaeota archaeon]